MVSTVYRHSKIFQLEVCPAPSATSLARQEDSPVTTSAGYIESWGPSPGEATQHDCRTQHWRAGGQEDNLGVRVSQSHNKYPKYCRNIQ